MYLSQRNKVKAKIVTAGVTTCALSAFTMPAVSAAPAQVASIDRSTVSSIQAAAAPGSIDSRVRGTFGRDGTVRGTFSPDRFFVKGGEAYANGVLHATLRRANGSVVGTATRRITVPVRGGSADAAKTASRGAVCDILNLVLGPLDLNLLGLEIHLNRVRLDIVANPGPGNLLGNLLCAVANLLNGDGSLLNLLRLTNVLNRILAVLRLG
jgi:hypothetical protein